MTDAGEACRGDAAAPTRIFRRRRLGGRSVRSAAAFSRRRLRNAQVAAWLAKRIGLVNTMVYTHLPSNVCLVLIPFVSERNVYRVILLRGFLSQMDVPARESYMTGIVPRDERVACSRTIMLARAVAVVCGPPAAAALWRARGAAAPLVFAGVAKSCYDLSLLAVFRRVRPPEEAPADLPTAAAPPRPVEKSRLLEVAGPSPVA